MPPPRPRVGIDVKSFYDDPTAVDWCRDGVCFVELGAASGHPDFMRRLRGVDGPHGYNPTVQESGTFLFICVWAIRVTSMTSCFVHRRLWHVCADAARRAVAWDIEHEGLVDQKIHAFAIFQMEKHWGELEEDGRALFLPSGIKGREMRYEFTCVVTDSPGEDQVRLLQLDYRNGD